MLAYSVAVEKAKRGDLILFTGTDPLEKDIGHMGIVVSNTIADGLMFIHATSGRAMSVTTSKLNEQYTKRFVRVSRIFSLTGREMVF
jgi:cell wall-associated NlpC family hydrolase